MKPALPSIEEFPIPRDVAPGPAWSAGMRDMAAHIGAYPTLLISVQHGGENIYIPADATRNPFLPLIGAEAARALSWVYRRETIAVPTAAYAIARARRGGLVAAVRSGRLTVSDLARIIDVRRDYASKLVNRTDEGATARPAAIGAAKIDPRQLNMFAG